MSKDILKNWIALNSGLKNLSLDEVRKLLKVEQAGKNRKTFVKRIQQRIIGAEMEKVNARYSN
jgi:hypothetical protein